MIRRREELKTTFKNRRRGKSFASDHSAAGSSVGRIAVGEVGKPKEEDPWCKRNNVTSSSTLHDVTASTVSISFDTSFNSGNEGITSTSPVIEDCSTPTVKKVISYDDHSPLMKENHQTLMQLQTNKGASDVFPSTPAESVKWTSSLTPETGLTPEKDQSSDNDWDPFGDDDDDEFAAQASPAAKILFDASPVGVNDMDSFSRKQMDVTRTSQPSSVKKSSAKEDMLRSLREENERLKNEIREASEEAGTLDAAGALVDERSGGDIADECTLEEGTLATSFYEGIIETGMLEEGTINTSFYEDTVDTGIVDEGTLTTDLYTVDEGAASYNSRSEGDWDEVSLESEFGSDTSGSPRKRKNARNVTDAGPSSPTLRQALRRHGNTGAVTSTCPSVFEELMDTYEDASDAFNQVLNAFFVSLDDVDKTSDAISGVKEQLRFSHTDKFVPISTKDVGQNLVEHKLWIEG